MAREHGADASRQRARLTRASRPRHAQRLACPPAVAVPAPAANGGLGYARPHVLFVAFCFRVALELLRRNQAG
jgi:hypothetical protein